MSAEMSTIGILADASEMLWRHGESGGGSIIPKELCFELSTQFDCTVDEHSFGTSLENVDLSKLEKIAVTCMKLIGN